jgi:hypothetical protein
VATSLALASPSFYDISASFLWKELWVHSNQELRHIAALLKSGPTFDPAIRLGNSTLSVRTVIRREECDYRALATLVQHTPNLRILTLENHKDEFGRQGPTYGDHELDRVTTTLACHCNLLELLQFREPLERPSLQDLFIVSEGCPNLRHLHLSNISLAYEREWDQLDTVVFPNLTVLKLGNSRPMVTLDTVIPMARLLAFLRTHRGVMPRMQDLHVLESLYVHQENLTSFANLICTGLVRFTPRFPLQLARPLLYDRLRTLVIDIVAHDVALPSIPYSLPALESLHVRQQHLTFFPPDIYFVEERCEELLSSLLSVPPVTLNRITVWIPTHPVQPRIRRLITLARDFRRVNIQFVIQPQPIPITGHQLPDRLFLDSATTLPPLAQSAQ